MINLKNIYGLSGNQNIHERIRTLADRQSCRNHKQFFTLLQIVKNSIKYIKERESERKK